MKVLTWYSAILIILTELVLIADWLTLGYGEESETTLIAIVIFAPTTYYIVKKLIEIYRKPPTKE